MTRSSHAIRTALAAATVLGLCGMGSPGHAQDGEALFRRACAVCHTVEAGKNRVGPSLAGIVGSKAGSVPGFAYSDANKAAGVWDDASLNRYLEDPKAFMPGTKMVYAGMKNPDDRKALIEYLRAAK